MGTWVRTFHAVREARGRVVCFPHAGGAASAYHKLSAGLAQAGVQAVAVQYPGRQDRFRESCAERLETVVDAVLAELAGAYDDGAPQALFGHSMGAVIAFEAARRLEALGRGPSVLFVSGRQAPSLPWPPPGTRSLRDADDAELVRELTALSGDTAAALAHPELLAFALPALRGDYRMLEDHRYVPGPRLSCPVVALAGDQDPRVEVANVARWEEETRGGFEMRVLPGGHFFVQEQVDEVVKAVAGRM